MISSDTCAGHLQTMLSIVTTFQNVLLEDFRFLMQFSSDSNMEQFTFWLALIIVIISYLYSAYYRKKNIGATVKN